MKLYKIDDNGFVVFGEDKILIDGEEIPEGYVSTYLDTSEQGYFKPRWNGTEWVEGATQEEIDEITNVPTEPTQDDFLLDLELRVTMLELGL
ncbi:hypothetical protein [Metasolibacillus sp.]|uniref:hypothetical protein n=1 Tax=Metasolibacillus sp. TaxID=2703680 RepID=UPI0025DB6AF8|nr:hypothetical protein [Metasolibacillus sp.]MCT6924833.1 hypothetical protein [Metasolibacillus sp.]MCT6941101.1 hypothetical protein [Metasolibacillus sp.]